MVTGYIPFGKASGEGFSICHGLYSVWKSFWGRFFYMSRVTFRLEKFLGKVFLYVTGYIPFGKVSGEDFSICHGLYSVWKSFWGRFFYMSRVIFRLEKFLGNVFLYVTGYIPFGKVSGEGFSICHGLYSVWKSFWGRFFYMSQVIFRLEKFIKHLVILLLLFSI